MPITGSDDRQVVGIYSFDLFPDRHLTAFPGWPFPNALFDPAHGVADYAEHIEEAVLCETLGFDGVIAGPWLARRR